MAEVSVAPAVAVAPEKILARDLARRAAATFAVRNASWFSPVPWGFTLIIAHLGLLAWEATQVSATLAFPALKPKPARPARSGRGPLSFRPGKGL